MICIAITRLGYTTLDQHYGRCCVVGVMVMHAVASCYTTLDQHYGRCYVVGVMVMHAVASCYTTLEQHYGVKSWNGATLVLVLVLSRCGSGLRHRHVSLSLALTMTLTLTLTLTPRLNPNWCALHKVPVMRPSLMILVTGAGAKVSSITWGGGTG